MLHALCQCFAHRLPVFTQKGSGDTGFNHLYVRFLFPVRNMNIFDPLVGFGRHFQCLFGCMSAAAEFEAGCGG